MKKIDVGQTIQILANLGVIASIAFLALQLREASNQYLVSTSQELTHQVSEWEQLLAANSELSEIYSRGLDAFSDLTREEQLRFDLLMRSRLRIAASGLLAADRRTIASSSSLAAGLSILLRQPGFQQWWAQTGGEGLPTLLVQAITEQRRTSSLESR